MVDQHTPVLFGDDKTYTAADLRRVCAESGLHPGDIVMIHSRLFTLGRFNTDLAKDTLLDAFIDALKEIVGPAGTLIFPTFSLSVCRSGVFNATQTPSEMGILSERARRRDDSRRTTHPLYSVAMIGAGHEQLMNARVDTSFGPGSLFDHLHRMNTEAATEGRVKFMTIGMSVPTEGLTFVHYIEELCNVPYRYHKTFRGDLITGPEDQHGPSRYSVDFFVRDLSTDVIFDQDALWDLLHRSCPVHRTPLGNSSLAVIPEHCLFTTTRHAIQAQADFLCKGGYHPPGNQ